MEPHWRSHKSPYISERDLIRYFQVVQTQCFNHRLRDAVIMTDQGPCTCFKYNNMGSWKSAPGRKPDEPHMFRIVNKGVLLRTKALSSVNHTHWVWIQPLGHAHWSFQPCRTPHDMSRPDSPRVVAEQTLHSPHGRSALTCPCMWLPL